jgi:hypothetical protein
MYECRCNGYGDGASRFFFFPKKKTEEEGVWGGMVRIVNGEVVDDNAPAPPSSLGAFPSFSSGSLLHCISA